MSRQHRRRPSPDTQGHLRIIGGRWRGRKLRFTAIDGLRPTGDRIRETLFNWLGAEVHGMRCLDLFAGSGALGLESLSRGADMLTLVERDPLVVLELKQHCQTLGAKQAAVIQADALNWVKSAEMPPFDLVFVDPPFASGLVETALNELMQSGLVTGGSLLYIEHGKQEQIALPESLRQLREKATGNVVYGLYEYHPEDTVSESASDATTEGER